MTNFAFVFGTLDQIISTSILILFNFFFIFYVGFKNRQLLFRSILIYGWHTCFCLFYVYHSLTSVSDSLTYFENAYYFSLEESNINYLNTYTPAVIFVRNMVSFLINYFNFSYLGVFLFYNFIGFLALLCIDSSLNKLITSNNKVTTILKNIIVFIPSISFWSAGIGKDTIALFSLSFLLWLYLYKKNYLLVLLAFLLFYYVRPQHALILVISSILTLFFINNKNHYLINFKYFKLVLFLFISISFFVSINYLLKLTLIGFQINDFYDLISLELYNQFNEQLKIRQSLPDYYGSGYIDLPSILFLTELFTYLFRPMIFEANSLFTLVSSFENFIILIIFIYGFYCFSNHKTINDRDKIFIIFFILALIPLSSLTPNFGISARQKWIILIPFFYFLVSTIDKYLNLKNNKIK